MPENIQKKYIPDYLIYGFAISTIGGPLAIIGMNLLADPPLQPIGIQAILAVLIFLFPVLVWYKYSKKIASSGGLYSFVKEAAGEKVAKVQGLIFIVSYFLYLPYTITFIVYYLLPVVFPSILPYAPFLEVLLPIAVVIVMLSGLRKSLALLSLSALIQVILIIALAATLFVKVSPNLTTVFTPSSSIPDLFTGAAGISLFFICGSLLVFLGGEAKGGSKIIQKALIYSFIGVGVLLILISIPLSQIPQGLQTNSSSSELPIFQITSYYTNNNVAIVVGLFAIISTAGLIFAEFIALSRLASTMFKADLNKVLIWISGLFIVSDIVSLINPQAFYNNLLLPSLITLYISQFMVFAVYPLYAKKNGNLSVSDVAIAAISSILMLYGLYSGLVAPSS